MSEPTCQFYLVTPPLGEAAGFGPTLEAALGAGDVACVLLRLARVEEGAAKAILKPLVAAVRAHGAAALIEDDTRLVGYVDADGVHLTGAGDTLDQTLRSMKPARIVGCGGLATRDDAMLAGESGVDYVMFGDGPDPASFDERRDQAAWWAEIFEIPCVACAAALDEVMPLAETGVEFVALGDAVWADPRGPAQAVRDAMAALADGASRAAARLAALA